MSSNPFTLGKELKGEATPGQKKVIPMLLRTEQGMENLLKHLDKQLAGIIIERAKGRL